MGKIYVNIKPIFKQQYLYCKKLYNYISLTRAFEDTFKKYEVSIDVAHNLFSSYKSEKVVYIDFCGIYKKNDITQQIRVQVCLYLHIQNSLDNIY